MAEQICLKWNNHMNMMNEFRTFLLSEDMVDVTLSCEGNTLKVHKLILSVCSPFFRALFLENPCKHPIVIFNDVKYLDLKTLIEYMYFGEVKVNVDNLPTLMKVAESLKVKGLGELKSNSTRSNNESENQSMDELEYQHGDESENQSDNESENQLFDEAENQSEDELEKKPLIDEISTSPVDETVHQSLFRVNLSKCKLTEEQIESYQNGNGNHEPQTEREVLGDHNMSFKSMLSQSQNINHPIRKKLPEQHVDSNPDLVESSENSEPSLLEEVLTSGYILQQSRQSSMQSNKSLQQTSSDNSCNLIPVSSQNLSPDGSIIGCQEAEEVLLARKAIELRKFKKDIVEKACNSEKVDVNCQSNSKPEKASKKTQDFFENTKGKGKSRKHKSGSSKLQHSNSCMAIKQEIPNLKECTFQTFQCTNCSFVTTTKKFFLQHAGRCHKKNKQIAQQTYSCEMCSYSTGKKCNLRKHLIRTHKIFVKNLKL